MTKEQFRKMVVVQYEKLVFFICYQFVKDYGEAQNLTQETFLSAYLHLDSCREEKRQAPGWGASPPTNPKIIGKRLLPQGAAERADGETPGFFICSTLLTGDVYIEKEAGGGGAGLRCWSSQEPYHLISVLSTFWRTKPSRKSHARSAVRSKTVQTQLYRAKVMLKNA